MLAGISVDYVVRLEQGRGPVPSEQVLEALARAVRLSIAERDELFHLAGTTPPGPDLIPMDVRPSVLRLIDRFSDLPTIVLSAKGDVLAWNSMASALHGDWSAIPPERRNLTLLRFLPDARFRLAGKVAPGDGPTDAQAVQNLRAAAARYPRDPQLADLISELKAGSAVFRKLWDAGGADVWRTHHKTVIHPEIGEVSLDCDTLSVPDDDQLVVVYSAAPGTPEAESLALLQVVGTQRFSRAST
jgi:transcriptional regulator with XRE-family HTH domain